MALLLTNDEEAILSTLLVFRRSIGKAKRVGQRCVEQPEELRSRNQVSRENQAHLDASIAFVQWQAGRRMDRVQEQAIATEATFWRKHTCQLPSFGRSLRLYHLTKISVRGD